MEENMNQWVIIVFSGFGGAILGAIIGGIAASLGQYLFTKKHTTVLERKTVSNLSKAIYCELTSLWERYMTYAGKTIEDAGESEEAPPLIGMLETPQNYFIIFESSSNLLGLFEPDVAEKIIKVYINAKALHDELIHYGKLTHRFMEANLGYRNTDKITESSTIHPQLLEYFKFLKKRHFEVKELHSSTIEVLKTMPN